MPAIEQAPNVIKILTSDPEVSVYAILDGASVPNLLPSFQKHQPDYVCLYRGELEPDLAETAPYLAQLEPESDFLDWLVETGWGQHWGIFLTSEGDLRTLRLHFRKFLMVHDESGKPLYFRYYDPRVLRVYLPTCNEEELKKVFGPVQRYFMEAEDPNTLLEFRFQKGKLTQRSTPLTKKS